jgi:hypothetical protein
MYSQILDQYKLNERELSAHKIISANAQNIILNRIEYTNPPRGDSRPRDFGSSWRS